MNVAKWKRDLGPGFVVVRPNPQIATRLLVTARRELRHADDLIVSKPTLAAMTAEQAARLAINALATHDGVRIDSPNKHAAAVAYAEQRPRAFDAPTVGQLDNLRRLRNRAMYGDERDEYSIPVEVDERTARGAVTIAGRVVQRVVKVTARPIPPPPGHTAARDPSRGAGI